MMSEFEKQVRHALIDRDMTMTDLANELGITISYVSDLLKGKRTNQEQLQRIKEFLEITESKVFTYESITEIKVKNPESDDEVTMYEFTLTEYDKDEYIRIQAEKNASLEEQMTQAQEAMCEIYEMMV